MQLDNIKTHCTGKTPVCTEVGVKMEILTVILNSLTVFSLSNAAVFSSEFETKLQTFIDSSMKCRHIPSMTL